jgi:hypothetical protein
MLTKKQANKMRGKLINLLQVADDYAHRGALPTQDSIYVTEDYKRLKREFLDEIKNLTEDEK